MTLQAALLAAGIPNLTGVSWGLFANAIAAGVQQWLPTVQLTGVSTGVAGTGQVQGTLQVPPFPGMGALLASMGVSGVISPLVGEVVSLGVASGLTGATYRGVSIGVGQGSDISRVVLADSTALSLSLQQAFLGMGVAGVSQAQLAQALGVGISTQVLLGVGVGAVTGVGGGLPSVGQTQSRL